MPLVADQMHRRGRSIAMTDTHIFQSPVGVCQFPGIEIHQ